VSKTFQFGVIEGFFGLPWTWRERADYAGFLAAHDFGFYLYTPKSDEVLRKNWGGAWSTADWAALVEVRAHYAERGVGFGQGFEPLRAATL
jgi:hyaluronoglucosaminidase